MSVAEAICGVLAGALIAASTSALAQTADDKMSCEQFRSALTETIHREGDKVAVPSDFQVAYSAPDDTRIQYQYAGIVGLSGSLNCVKGRFASFGISADLSETDAHEDGLRQLRSWALAQAALCARGGMSDDSCQSETLAIAKKAMDQFTKEADRDSRHPSGDRVEHFGNETQLDIDVTEGGLTISVAYWPPTRL
jgi:hypothetical protein